MSTKINCFNSLSCAHVVSSISMRCTLRGAELTKYDFETLRCMYVLLNRVTCIICTRCYVPALVSSSIMIIVHKLCLSCIYIANLAPSCIQYHSLYWTCTILNPSKYCEHEMIRISSNTAYLYAPLLNAWHSILEFDHSTETHPLCSYVSV